MAIFDPREQRVVIRVVYDGAAGAGKTTNLRQLSALFAAQRASEVHSPGELGGRTLYFDWMQVRAGALAGIPLLCQIISVPGQVVLTPRRRHLLESADVVVYVCDGSAAAAAASRDGLCAIDAIARERGSELPLVVQANKQDQRDALSAEAMARALGRPEASVVEAIATEGVGVVDTFVAAIRTLSRRMQRSAETGELRLEVRCAETENAAFARVAAREVDPEWAAEMFLEEVSRELLLEAFAEGPETAASPAPAIAAGDVAPPSLPDAEAPTGFIWPAHTGRATLRAMAAAGGLADRPRRAASGAFTHEGGGRVLRTHSALRYESADNARQALVRAARERTQLEQLLAPDTVVVAHAASDTAWWIWTAMPRLPTLREVLAQAGAPGPSASSLLDAYGAALAEAFRVSIRYGFGLSLELDAFGVDGHVLRYVGDTRPALAVDHVSSALAHPLTELERAGADVGAVLAAFERELQRRLTPEERSGLLPEGERTPVPRTHATAAARMHAVLARAGGAT